MSIKTTVADTKGFEITLHDAQHILRMRIWGCWDLELAKKYGDALSEKFYEISEHQGNWKALVDLTAFFPRSEDVQNMLREQITAVSEYRITKIAYLGAKEGVELRLNQLFRATERPLSAFFASQDAALHWLLSE